MPSRLVGVRPMDDARVDPTLVAGERDFQVAYDTAGADATEA